MLLRILTRPTGTIDGVSLDLFDVGGVYEVGYEVACLCITEGWAEAVTGHEAALSAHAPPPEIASIHPLVLVVDDEPEIQHLTESLLTAHGYRVVVAGDGEDAIQRLRERCPDLIVLDLNMPIMNGWQFRTEQRYFLDKTRATVPVLVMTAADDTIAATHADTLRAVGVLRKPFDPDALLEAVSAAIQTRGSAPDGIQSTRPWKANGRGTK